MNDQLAVNHGSNVMGDSMADARPDTGNRRSKRWSDLLRLREIQLTLLILVIFFAMTAYRPLFDNQSNVEFLLLGSVVLGIVTIGQTVVIITKGIDLSVAPIMGLSAVVTGMLAQQRGLPITAAVGIALAIGIVLGAINGLLVVVGHIPPIIATLGTFGLFGGFQFLVTNGAQVSGVPEDFNSFGNGQLVPWVPFQVVLLVLLTVAAMVILRWTVFGRNVMAVGNNESSARIAGVRVRWVVFSTYVISGCLAGFAGLVYVAHVAAATAVTGTSDNYHLQSIAAALIGGTLISGACWPVCF
jgi:ribose/xylose/arabinose/galactoside ABC-type transport system permease subunit